jgi:hypothetical protein
MESAKKFFLLGFIILVLVTIPLTLYFAKQQQDLRSSATPASNLSFVTTKDTLNVGDTTTLDVMLDPKDNIPSFAKLTVLFDPLKIEIVSFAGDSQNAPTTLAAPKIASSSASIELGISKLLTGYDPTQSISQPIRIATITVKAKAITGGTPTRVSFDHPGATEIFSIAESDGAGENVLSNATPINLIILGSAQTSPTTSPTRMPSATPVVTRTVTPLLTPTPTIPVTTAPATPTATLIPTAGAILPTEPPAQPPPIAAPGSFGTILGVGGAFLLTIIGGLLLFGL